jgi:hypothetical protein
VPMAVTTRAERTGKSACAIARSNNPMRDGFQFEAGWLLSWGYFRALALSANFPLASIPRWPGHSVTLFVLVSTVSGEPGLHRIPFCVNQGAPFQLSPGSATVTRGARSLVLGNVGATLVVAPGRPQGPPLHYDYFALSRAR